MALLIKSIGYNLFCQSQEKIEKPQFNATRANQNYKASQNTKRPQRTVGVAEKSAAKPAPKEEKPSGTFAALFANAKQMKPKK